MGMLNIGTRALQANQVALQTTGNNIANVNTPGYSRQSVVLETVKGQFTGGGYIGQGVGVQTIQRNFNEFLTRQSAMASATQSADTTRASKLKQLENLFPGGASGLGASINDMLNAFSDVATAPTDLTARTVVLTRVDETAARMRSTSQQLDDLQQGVTQELTQKIDAINSLAKNIANVNADIARANGNGQPPNDLLDRRDQMVRDLNQYIQTSSIPANDGTVGIFIGGSQALVLGTTTAKLALGEDDFGQKSTKLAITSNGVTTGLDENTLGGGEVSGLLRFQNTDLAEGRNLLGRLTLAVTTAMNDQQKLGLDLDGNVGPPLFSATALPNGAPNKANTGAASLTVAVQTAPRSGLSALSVSNYTVSFTSPTAGRATRQSDGVQTAFTLATGPSPAAGTLQFYNPATLANDLPALDGLAMAAPAGVPAAGDSFLLKPFSTAASNIRREFSSPRALAVSSPVAGSMGTSNTGSLQLQSLAARSNPPSITPVVLSFTGPNSYTRSDATPPTTSFTFTPGAPIEGTVPTTAPLSQWSVTLQGSPKAGDTFTVNNSKVLAAAGKLDLKLNAGNANAMMDLRDKALFDGAALSDGYAGLMTQIGVRGQSANYAAQVSTSIAANLEKDRAGVSGVNLDEEAAKLLQFQQAYQASAKMIQIAQNIFDTLIQGMR